MRDALSGDRLTVWTLLVSLVLGAVAGAILWLFWDSGLPREFYFAVLLGAAVGFLVWTLAVLRTK